MDIYQVINRPSVNFSDLVNVNMDEIVYKPIYPEKTFDVIHHLRHNFFADEPLNKSVALTKRGDPHKDLEDYSLNTINQGVSYMGVLCSTGEIVGVLLNGFKTKQENTETNHTLADPKLKKIFDFLENVDKDVDFLKDYDAQQVFEIRILSVDQKFRGRGIGKRLCAISENLAAGKGFKLMRADATAFYSQKLLEKVGYSTLKEIVYAEYPSRDEPLFKTEPPHTKFKLMVKEIKDGIR